MPASGFHWSPCPPQGGVFQVYGTKRKAEGCEDHWHMDMEDQPQELVSPKRHCVRAGEPMLMHQQPAHHLPMEMNAQMEIGNSQPLVEGMEESTAVTVAPWLQQAQQMPQGTLQDPNGASINNILPNCVPMMDQAANKDPCNLASHKICDMEAAAITMDNDYQPDPSQYTALAAATDTACPGLYTSAMSAGSGDSRPTPSRVRCYCKPSWEGMMHMRPYVSDIY